MPPSSRCAPRASASAARATSPSMHARVSASSALEGGSTRLIGSSCRDDSRRSGARAAGPRPGRLTFRSKPSSRRPCSSRHSASWRIRHTRRWLKRSASSLRPLARATATHCGPRPSARCERYPTTKAWRVSAHPHRARGPCQGRLDSRSANAKPRVAARRRRACPARVPERRCPSPPDPRRSWRDLSPQGRCPRASARRRRRQPLLRGFGQRACERDLADRMAASTRRRRHTPKRHRRQRDRPLLERRARPARRSLLRVERRERITERALHALALRALQDARRQALVPGLPLPLLWIEHGPARRWLDALLEVLERGAELVGRRKLEREADDPDEVAERASRRRGRAPPAKKWSTCLEGSSGSFQNFAARASSHAPWAMPTIDRSRVMRTQTQRSG